MVAPAEFLSNLQLGHAGDLPHHIHGDLPCCGDLVAAAFAADLLRRNAVGARHLINDTVNGHGQRRLVGHNVLNGVFRQTNGNRGAVQSGVGVHSLHNALQLPHIILYLAGDERRHIFRHLHSQAFRLTGDDRHAGLIIRRLYINQQT